MPTVASASASGRPPWNTRLPIMSGAKRAPSSLVKKATATGRRVATTASFSAAITSSPASTPRLASPIDARRRQARFLRGASHAAASAAASTSAALLPTMRR